MGAGIFFLYKCYAKVHLMTNLYFNNWGGVIFTSRKMRHFLSGNKELFSLNINKTNLYLSHCVFMYLTQLLN